MPGKRASPVRREAVRKGPFRYLAGGPPYIKSGSAGGRAEKDQLTLAPRRAADPSAWITAHRRTVRDYERLPGHHETIVYWAMTITMSRRLARRPAAQPTAT
jgi:hypothetical protein